MKITGWNGVIDTPIHGVIDNETGKYYYGVSDDNSDSYYICTCSLDSKGKNGTMKGYTLQTSSGNITFSMMFYIGIGDTGTYTYGDKSKFPIFPCRMGRDGL